MRIKDNLKYTKSHEWVQYKDDKTVMVGLTDYAQASLGGLVFINLPEKGDEVIAGEIFADVESVKAVSDVYSPVSGTVSDINEELLDTPANINNSPYEAWLVIIENITDTAELLSAEEYEKYVKENEAV